MLDAREYGGFYRPSDSMCRANAFQKSGIATREDQKSASWGMLMDHGDGRVIWLGRLRLERSTTKTDPLASTQRWMIRTLARWTKNRAGGINTRVRPSTNQGSQKAKHPREQNSRPVTLSELDRTEVMASTISTFRSMNDASAWILEGSVKRQVCGLHIVDHSRCHR